MPALTEETKLTKTEIKELKDEIKGLYANYRTRRLELGIKLLKLQDAIALPGRGTFVAMVRDELGIPVSTCYDTMDYAKEEIRKAGLSESRKDEDDNTFDFDELATLIAKRYPEEKKVRPPKRYLTKTPLSFIFKRETRLEVAAAWKILKGRKQELKALSAVIAKEIIHAAADIEKNAK